MESCIHGLDIRYCDSCKPKYIRKPIISQKYSSKILDNEYPIHPIPLYFLFRYVSSIRKFDMRFDTIDEIITEVNKKYEELLKDLIKKNIGKLPWKYPFGNMKKSLHLHEYKEIKWNVIKYINDPIWEKLPDNFNDDDICTYFTIKLKNQDMKTIDNFANWIIDSGIVGKEEKTICCVPSSNVGEKSGIHFLCDMISNKNHKVLNANECIVRTKQIQKSHLSGIRSKETHLESIEIKNSEKLKGKKILLVDDVATSCSTLMACVEKIKVINPLKIETLVLGRTGYEYK